MALSEAASDEVVALEAILGADCWIDDATVGRIVLAVAPEAVDDTELFGALALEVVMPPDYPDQVAAIITCASLSQYAHHFVHRVPPAEGFFVPAPAQAAELATVIASTVADRQGEAVVFDVVAAVREWLEANTLTAKSESAEEVSAMMAEAEVSEDDLELDEEDMDEEMIEAMMEVLEGDKAQLKKLRAAEGLPSGSAQQRAAIKEVWLSLTKQQRRQMVEDSDGEDSDGEDSDGESEEIMAPQGRGGSGGSGGAKQKKAPAMPPAAQRACPRGHTLTPVNSQPHDYRKLGAGVGSCDLCSVDFAYTKGGYHCDQCRNWDCCVACGSTPAVKTGGGGQGKGKKGKHHGR